MSAEQWLELKASHRAKALDLWMPCCKVPAIPKTSPRGTFFFAHARRGECTTADESQEHLYCKSLIAKAALDAGWSVTTERPGMSPQGEEWVADVFCEKGAAKLAFEVQMSPQTDAETERRQQRYKVSGVRGAWFFGARARQATIVFDRDTPAFSLRPVVVGELPTVDRFEASLPEFVKAMLQKRLNWTIPRYNRPHLVQFIEDECWACKQPVKQVLEHLAGSSTPDGEALTAEDFYEGRWDSPAYTVASISKLLEAMRAVVSNDELAAQGLNLIGRKDVINGKPTRFPFCNMCLHCRAPQNNHFLSQRLLAVRQGQAFFESMDEERASAPVETGAFGVALIPRELEGRGLWLLQRDSNLATP
ncbi:hypothetical protein [Hydrogenophaga sp.]|uniref:competence protein CoiA family protein n=1 Tax=Hydrogenophaga sp. TaxID=1904254 RepID=UPI00272F8AF0|nr:hypothetical protein [Hydrogenophaga sp.]MDP1686106.1 hypothetical protein [Hydrogenophaga sp.]